jgi:hypothetical protein
MNSAAAGISLRQVPLRRHGGRHALSPLPGLPFLALGQRPELSFAMVPGKLFF